MMHNHGCAYHTRYKTGHRLETGLNRAIINQLISNNTNNNNVNCDYKNIAL